MGLSQVLLVLQSTVSDYLEFSFLILNECSMFKDLRHRPSLMNLNRLSRTVKPGSHSFGLLEEYSLYFLVCNS